MHSITLQTSCVRHTFKMGHHASYALRLNLTALLLYIILLLPSPWGFVGVGFFFVCLVGVILFCFRHKFAFNLSIYSRQCLHYFPAPSMITGMLMVRQLFSLIRNFKCCLSQNAE